MNKSIDGNAFNSYFNKLLLIFMLFYYANSDVISTSDINDIEKITKNIKNTKIDRDEEARKKRNTEIEANNEFLLGNSYYVKKDYQNAILQYKI